MNNVFLSVLSILLIAFTGNAPASCIQEGNLFIEKTNKIKPLYQKCNESKINSKACKYYEQELKKAMTMQKLVFECIKDNGVSEANIQFLDKTREINDDTEKYSNRLRLEAMKKM